jgi:hypothetical protein
MAGHPLFAFAWWRLRRMEPVKDMELRDWFAGQALAAIIIQSASLSLGSEPLRKKGSLFAERAYEFADAMLEERRKHPGSAGAPKP